LAHKLGQACRNQGKEGMLWLDPGVTLEPASRLPSAAEVVKLAFPVFHGLQKWFIARYSFIDITSSCTLPCPPFTWKPGTERTCSKDAPHLPGAGLNGCQRRCQTAQVGV
jgi:hypothetical protein